MDKRLVKELIDREEIEVLQLEHLEMEIAPANGFRRHEKTGTIVLLLRDRDAAKRAAVLLEKAG